MSYLHFDESQRGRQLIVDSSWLGILCRVNHTQLTDWVTMVSPRRLELEGLAWASLLMRLVVS